MSVAQFNTKIDEAVAAYEDGDIATGIQKLDVALLLMGKLPDGKGMHSETTWDRKHLIATRDAWQKKLNAQAAASAGGIRTTRLTPTKAGIE